MKIFKQIKSSIYDKHYYKNIVLNETFKESLKYLLKLSLVVALLGVIVFSFSVPAISKTIKRGVSSFVAGYPDDLAVSIKDGHATVNKPEPYVVKMPDNLINSNDLKALEINNLIAINTKEPFNINKFHSYSAVSLLTNTELVLIQAERGAVKILPLSNMGNIEITKTLVLEKEIYINKILPWIMAFMVPFVYIILFIVIFISTIMLLFFYAVTVWVLLKLKGIKLSYLKSYQVAIHASTTILIFGVFSSFFGSLNNSLLNILILITVVHINFDTDSNLTKEEEIVLDSKNE
ncbi:MAG: DUF1189 family protein [Candidatus Nomurabacteria bacterium]|nr:DUF1189 family protein [Candidatus Nomurabacteria bacterium]